MKKDLIPDILNLEFKTEHFYFYYNKSLKKKSLKDLSDTLENNFKRICNFFNVKNNFYTNVFIYPSIETFHLDMFGEKSYEWIVGCGGASGFQIVDPNKALATHDYQSMLLVAVHEFIHVVTYLSGKSYHSWISEGIALYLSNQYKNKKKFFNHIPNTKAIFGNDYHEFQTKGGYFFSGSIIDYIIQKYSEDKMKEILKNPKRDPFDILGVKKESFIRSWKKFVKDNC